MNCNTRYAKPEFALYLLGDPRTGKIRYVGRSKNPATRLSQHHSEHSTTPINRWARRLKSKGLRAVMVVLEWACDIQREFDLIRHYKSLGCQLLNVETQPHNLKDRQVGAPSLIA
jgi:hypothetical protein